MNIKPIIVGILVVIVAAVAGLFWYHSSTTQTPQHFYTVESAAVTSSVTSTGTVTASTNVDLSFQKSAEIAAVNVNVGDTVYAGETLAALDASDINAQLAQAQAAVVAQEAVLNGLQAGAQPEDIAASQAAVAGAQQTLANIYGSIANTSATTYSEANDAVRNQLSSLFSNAETSQPALTFQSSDSQDTLTAENLRASASVALNSWQAELASTTSASATTTSALLLQNELGYLKIIQNLLNTTSTVVNGAENLSSTQLAAYKAQISAGITETNGAVTSLTTISQNIASQNLTIEQLQAQLALKQAGSTSQQITAQEAMVNSAQASVQNLQAQLSDTVIVSPIAGTVTAQNAKVGQTAAPGTPVISLISNGTFQVDSYFPETIIGEIAVGGSASVTLDSYGSGVVFGAKVITIDPAETTVNGVPSYKVTLQFDNVDSRIRAGMTANVSIDSSSAVSTSTTTGTATSTVAVPVQSVIEQNNLFYVDLKNSDGSIVLQPVTLGVTGSDGMVQVLSGLTDGDTIVTFN